MNRSQLSPHLCDLVPQHTFLILNELFVSSSLRIAPAEIDHLFLMVSSVSWVLSEARACWGTFRTMVHQTSQRLLLAPPSSEFRTFLIAHSTHLLDPFTSWKDEPPI